MANADYMLKATDVNKDNPKMELLGFAAGLLLIINIVCVV